MGRSSQSNEDQRLQLKNLQLIFIFCFTDLSAVYFLYLLKTMACIEFGMKPIFG